MPDSIITYPFTENFINRLAEDVITRCAGENADFRKLAIVFPGRRPALFLRREMARRLGRSFYPPRFFSIDEFIRVLLSRQETFSAVKDLDQSYLLYTLTRRVAPEILGNRKTFAEFLPWGKEIQRFIESLDLEQVEDEQLGRVQASARIGYDVPEEMNELLSSIVTLRQAYHRYMREQQVYSRGFQYLRAAAAAGSEEFSEFDRILFCNFFYLNRCESHIVKSFYDRGRAGLVFQGDSRRWPVLAELEKKLGVVIHEAAKLIAPAFELKLYSAFDVHSQVAMARELVRQVPHPQETVIVLPDPGSVIPIVSELSSVARDFNVSVGYPLERSALFSLFEFIFQAQDSRREVKYYARDYLRVLRHPLVKSLRAGPSAARILVHKIEEVLTGQEKSELAGMLFFSLEEIEGCDEIFELASATLNSMGETVSRGELREVLATVHQLLFAQWEGVGNFFNFAAGVHEVLNVFLKNSPLDQYPLNLKIAERMQDLAEEFQHADFHKEPFPGADIFKIFIGKVRGEMVAFSGSPLKGLQVLGLFETRGLNFKNVIVLDANEGVLPRLRVQDPLVPREVMLGLGLDRLEKEEEIQRYQFMRLISAARHVHIVYRQGRQHERSRFVEELLWQEEQKHGKVLTDIASRPAFRVQTNVRARRVVKTTAMLDFLRQHTFSASSINTYVRNPYEFYVSYVLGLKEKEDLLDEPENRQVGTFVHELLEEVFKGFVGRPPKIDAKFRKYFRAELSRKFDQTFARSMRSESFLLRSVLETRLERFLEAEGKRDVRELLFVEKEFKDTLKLSAGDIRFVYKLDRVDRLADGTVLILDYKTGSVDQMPKAIDRIESMELSRETIFANVKSFQIPLYFSFMDEHFSGDSVNAGFYNLRTGEIHDFFSERMTYDRPRVKSAFIRALDYVVTEIFDPAVDFVDNELS